jgi:hypothetical protein
VNRPDVVGTSREREVTTIAGEATSTSVPALSKEILMKRLQPHRTAQLVAPVILVAAGAALGAPAASADSPPLSWTNERVLICDGETVTTYLTPAGFGTPFHVVGSPDVIVPKHVEVILPGGNEAIVTVDVPGFNADRQDATHCTYVDPAGLAVDFWGLRS